MPEDSCSDLRTIEILWQGQVSRIDDCAPGIGGRDGGLDGCMQRLPTSEAVVAQVQSRRTAMSSFCLGR